MTNTNFTQRPRIPDLMNDPELSLFAVLDHVLEIAGDALCAIDQNIFDPDYLFDKHGFEAARFLIAKTIFEQADALRSTLTAYQKALAAPVKIPNTNDIPF